MDAEDFLETVRDARATELHRLGSDKYLIAATSADLADGPVLASVARTATSGVERFESWADHESGAAAETFAAAADTERDHRRRLAERLADADAAVPDDPGDDAVHAALAEAATTAERAGALVGRGLVADRTRLQVVNFFVNEGDSPGADFVRELRSDANDQVEAGADLLEAVCDDEDDWTVARDSVGRVVAAAYDEYASALEAMGVDPKPVC
ncbi:MAG: rubrerythrin family protein [Haloarculaceae archaeon]